MSRPQHFPDRSAAAVSSSLFCGEEEGSEVVQSIPDTWISTGHQFQSPYSPPPDENTIIRLIETEPQFMPSSDYLPRCRHRSVDVTARHDSVKWILKVHAYYRFRPVTALLSVNYFDRFLSYHSLPANGWPFQLLSVACLSLAAKMEEPHVPLLLDLQVLEPGFVFEPRTVRRMELWVMVNLNWRLRSVTPFDYLDYFISKLPSFSSSKPVDYDRVFAASSDLILSTTRAIDFLGFTPSTIAAAAVLSVAGESFDVPAADGYFFHEREMVRSCHQVMEEYLIDTCPSPRLTMAEPTAAPPSSPVGVLDAAACGSCDTLSENPSSSSQAEAGEPLVKRLRCSTSDVQQ